MGHFLLEIALSICFGIVGNLYQKIKHVSLGIRVNEDTIDMAALDMILHAPPYRMAFATVQVELHELRMEKGTLGIQIFAEFQHNDIAGVTSFKDNTIESVIDKYEVLKPLVTESINHIIDDLTNPTKPIRKIGRALTVRYRIHDQEYEINEDYEYDYDVEKISATVIPYLESLFNIRSMFVSELNDN